MILMAFSQGITGKENLIKKRILNGGGAHHQWFISERFLKAVIFVYCLK